MILEIRFLDCKESVCLAASDWPVLFPGPGIGLLGSSVRDSLGNNGSGWGGSPTA